MSVNVNFHPEHVQTLSFYQKKLPKKLNSLMSFILLQINFSIRPDGRVTHSFRSPFSRRAVPSECYRGGSGDLTGRYGN